jgi:hypothetical protein
VVTVHDVGETDDGLFFIAMELVEGTTLGRWLSQRVRSRQEVVHAYLEAGRGLAAAHDAGVVHRDFKPANVLVAAEGPRVFVTDFGLARMTARNVEDRASVTTAAGQNPTGARVDAITRSGALLGSPAYMSPEQLGGEAADLRSDIFSFCVSFWAGLYGARPFVGGTVDELRRAIAAQVPSPGKAKDRAEVPARIRDTLLKGLREAPDQRHQDMHALIAELERQTAHEGLSRAERILREADELFHPAEKPQSFPAVAVSLLEGALGERLRPPSRTTRPDLPNLPALEVSGRPMRRFMELVGPYEWLLSHFMTRAGLIPDADGIVRFDPDSWYPYALALDFARSEPFGPEMAHRIGYMFCRAVLETERVPADARLSVPTLHLVDDAFDRCLRLNGVTVDQIRAQRGAAGERSYLEREPGCIEMQTSGAARCATSLGYFAAVGDHFAKDVVVEHLDGPCRDKGALICRYVFKIRG